MQLSDTSLIVLPNTTDSKKLYTLPSLDSVNQSRARICPSFNPSSLHNVEPITAELLYRRYM